MATTGLKTFPIPELADCPQCQETITLYDPRGSEFCVCSSCHSFLQFVQEEEAKKVGSLAPHTVPPVIPLGTTGTFKGITFKVIAYMEKSEEDPKYKWREYILYNYEKGYASLSEYDGHWNLIFGENFLPGIDNADYQHNNSITFNGTKHRLFHKYKPKPIALSGEFDWNVYKERLSVAEYVAPPYIISREKEMFKSSAVSNYQGEYLEPKVLAKAFDLDLKTFPERIGTISNQPSKAYEAWYITMRATLVLVLAIIVAEYFIEQLKPQQVVMAEQFYITADPKKGANEFKPFLSPSFEIKDQSSFMDVELSSQVNNNWLEATIVLVNEATNQTWEINNAVEHYEGYEDGEHWTEGNRKSNTYLSEIPKGKYHLNVYPASGNTENTTLSIQITVNSIMWRNILAAIAALSICPLIAFFVSRRVEMRRWENSDYSPFHK